jgi:hypothetical protein
LRKERDSKKRQCKSNWPEKRQESNMKMKKPKKNIV